MKEILLTYFSRSGVIRKLLEDLTKVLDAKIYEVKSLKACPLERDECTQVAEREKEEEARPALAGRLPEIQGLKESAIGPPNWSDICPRCLLSFLEALDLSEVEIHPLAISEGSGSDGVNNGPKGQVKRTTKLHRATSGDQMSAEGLAARVRGEGRFD